MFWVHTITIRFFTYVNIKVDIQIMQNIDGPLLCGRDHLMHCRMSNLPGPCLLNISGSLPSFITKIKNRPTHVFQNAS